MARNKPLNIPTDEKILMVEEAEDLSSEELKEYCKKNKITVRRFAIWKNNIDFFRDRAEFLLSKKDTENDL